MYKDYGQVKGEYILNYALKCVWTVTAESGWQDGWGSIPNRGIKIFLFSTIHTMALGSPTNE